MTSNDPWAAAQAAVQNAAPAAPVAPQGQAVPDREKDFRSLQPGANPFATASTLGGGSGIRGPQWPDLLDRLIVLKPLRKLVDQPVHNQPNQKQDFYVCELTVLDGGPLTVVTPSRPEKGDLPATDEVRNTYELPMTFPDWYAYGRQITVKLDRLELPMWLGVVKRCPTGAGYRKGETWEDSTRAYNEWAERARRDPGRAGSSPQTSWGLIDASPEQQEAAMRWYQERQQQG